MTRSVAEVLEAIDKERIEIAEALGRGGVAILLTLISKKRKSEVIEMIESIDPKAFISVQSAVAYRGYVHSRK